MSLTAEERKASVLWLGGGREDLAKQRHKNGAYSVGDHDNADIIGNWHMSKFWDDSVIFARQKQINVIAVDNGTESWIGGVVGNVEVEEKVLALKMFAVIRYDTSGSCGILSWCKCYGTSTTLSRA